MKTLPTALATHYSKGTNTLADLLKITRSDGAVYAFTSAADDVTISSVNYLSSQGLNISSLEVSAGLAVDNLELTTLDDGTTFSRLDVLAGKWRNAAFVISRYNWASPADGVEVRMVGTIGDVQLRRGLIVAELRGLQQALQQPIGSVTSKTCRNRLGDTLCSVNLTSYTVSGSVTSVTSAQIFTDNTQVQAAEYFTDGVLTWVTGANAGLKQKVKAFTSGQFTLSVAMLSSVTIGDTFTVVAGCRKRLAEDCVGKFNNVINFNGEPHLPGVDVLTQ